MLPTKRKCGAVVGSPSPRHLEPISPSSSASSLSNVLGEGEGGAALRRADRVGARLQRRGAVTVIFRRACARRGEGAPALAAAGGAAPRAGSGGRARPQ